MADQDLSLSQLPSLPLPVQGSDLIHVFRSGRDYKSTKTNLLQQFLSGLEDVSLASLQAGHILIYNAVSGKWENSTLSWGSILSKPSVFPPATHVHSWSDLTEVPTSFTPSVHTHAWADLTGVPSEFPPEVHNHHSLYFTRDELSISGGGGAVHWDNITNVPELGGGSGDMSKSVYDPDEDGKVEQADFADTAASANYAATAGDATNAGSAEYAGTASHVPWLGIIDAPLEFTPSAHTHLWAEITDKPLTFAPNAHTHPWGELTGIPDGMFVNYKGVMTTAGAPNYPAGLVGDMWQCDDDGLIGGTPGGFAVHWGDFILCIADNAGGTEAAVGESWLHLSGSIGDIKLHNNEVGAQGNLVVFYSGHTVVSAECGITSDPSFPSGHGLDVPTQGAVKNWVNAQLAALPPSASAWGDITDKPDVFPPDAHTHLWADITDKPSVFTPDTHTHLWADIADKPSVFTPDTHTHLWADITDKPAVLTTGAGEIEALPTKATPADADKWLLEDSADSYSKKSVLWSSVKATLKTYNDTLYAAIGTIPICLQAGAASFSPADSTTYYFGCMPNEVPTSTDARYRIYIPMTGTVARVYVFWEEWGGVAGSAESIIAKFHYDGTTDTTISSVANANAAKVFSNTALNIAVTAGHYFEIAITCPAWATNPTLVRLAAVVYMY